MALKTGYFLSWALSIFPFYLFIRWPYFKLPIGPGLDCGFYISNNTIINKKINFAKGFNAHYSAGSNLITDILPQILLFLY